jgi:hypothetical protein
MDKSGEMKWARHVTQTGRRGIFIGYWWESQKGRDPLEGQDVGRVLRWFLDGMVWVG